MTSETEQQDAISPRAAILATVATFVLILFLGSAIIILLGTSMGMILGELSLVIVPLGYMLFRKVRIGSYIGFEIELKHVALGVAFGALLFFLNLIVTATLVSVFGVSQMVEESNQLVESTSGSLQGLVSVILALSLAGVCEEFVFRGFLQNTINRKYPFGVALIVSSLAFSFFHLDLQAVYTIFALLMGLTLGYIYHRWHSYVVSAMAHSTMNLIVLTIILLTR